MRRNRATWRWLLVGLLCLGTLGCATSGDLKRLEQKHMALDARFMALRTRHRRAALQLREVAQKLTKLNRVLSQFRKQGRYNFANIGTKLDELRTQYQETLGKFQVLRLEFDKLKKQITQPGAGGGTNGQVLTPEASYKLAQKLFAGSKYDQAILHLKNLVKTNPTHNLADDSYILVGDCYDKKGNAYEAIIWYNDVRKKYPSGDQVDQALFKLGLAHYKIGACPEGRNFLKHMLRKHRKSPRVAEARKLLRNWRSLCKKR